MTPAVTALLSIGSTLIDKIFPDKKQADLVKLRLIKLEQDGQLAALAAETELAKGQLLVNADEAKSENFFKSCWRPAVGWICVTGLSYNFIIQPLLSWVSGIHGYIAPPQLDIGDLMTLLFGLLGMGSLRTYERTKGVIPHGK